MVPNDTIAAVATAPGEGGVGIIRISGPDALAIGGRIFTSANKAVEEYEANRFFYGRFSRSAGKGSKAAATLEAHTPAPPAPPDTPELHSTATIDDGFLVYMKAPASYTGEDVVELFCHGGTLVTRKLLGAVLDAGARLAGPGEFTKRAFLSGRLDLSQAEAVADLISARSDAALASARARLDGALSKKVREVKERLLGLVVRIEAELDFEEDEIDELPDRMLGEGFHKARVALLKLLKTFELGRVINEGVRVLILGRRNVGKSSLLNILLREERAIVTPVAGTTRDLIEESVIIRGLQLRLMDTAGIGETRDRVEAKGVELAKEKIEQAELILLVIDASSGDFSDDVELMGTTGDKKIIVVANKIDLIKEGNLMEKAVTETFGGRPVAFISALKGEGIEGLEDAIQEVVVGPPKGAGSLEAAAGEYVVSIRHKEALSAALEGLTRAQKSLEKGAAREFIAADMRFSLDRLGEITGETTTDDILDRIFSEFCIGK